MLKKGISLGNMRVGCMVEALEGHLADDSSGKCLGLTSGTGFYAQCFARRWPGMQQRPWKH